MAYISEVHYRDNNDKTTEPSEYVEVVLSASEYEKASQYKISFYKDDATLGEVYSLGNLAPTLLDDCYIYVVEEKITRTGKNDGSVYAGVTLSKNIKLLQFYDIQGGSSELAPNTGPGAGQTPVALPVPAGNVIQIDELGNITNDGDSLGGTHICFCEGAMIATAYGEVPIEELQVGDLVLTADRGAQAIRWIGKCTFSALDLRGNPQLRPVRIRKEKLSENVPRDDLYLSPQHRVLVRSKITERMFNSEEVLIDAKHLCDIAGISQANKKEGVTYINLLFDNHEIIYAEGMPCESLHTGKVAMESLPPEARSEIEALFPHITRPEFKGEFVRKSPPNKRQKELIKRHIMRQRQLLDRQI